MKRYFVILCFLFSAISLFAVEQKFDISTTIEEKVELYFTDASGVVTNQQPLNRDDPLTVYVHYNSNLKNVPAVEATLTKLKKDPADASNLGIRYTVFVNDAKKDEGITSGSKNEDTSKPFFLFQATESETTMSKQKATLTIKSTNNDYDNALDGHYVGYITLTVTTST